MKNLMSTVFLGFLGALALSAYAQSAQAQSFTCHSTSLRYVENQTLLLTANRLSPTSISQVSLRLGKNFAELGSVIQLSGPINGATSKTDQNLMRFDISESKEESVTLYLPATMSAHNFQSRLRISFDGGYPLMKDMLCTF